MVSGGAGTGDEGGELGGTEKLEGETRARDGERIGEEGGECRDGVREREREERGGR